MTFSQVGAEASSKSASQIRAPELRALIVILRSVGPVISTRRSSSAAGAGATRQSPSRMCAVSGRKSSVAVRAISARRAPLRSSSSARRGANRRCSSARNVSASGVSTSSERGTGPAASETTAGDGALADMRVTPP